MEATTPEQFTRDLANEVLLARISRFQVLPIHDPKGRTHVTDPGPSTEAEHVWNGLLDKWRSERQVEVRQRGL